MQSPGTPEEDIRSPGATVTYSCATVCMGIELYTLARSNKCS